MTDTKKGSGNSKTPVALLSFARVLAPYTPKKSKDGPIFSATLVFTPEILKTSSNLKTLRVDAEAVFTEKFGAKGLKQAKMPFDDRPSDPDYAESKGYPVGSVFINTKRSADRGAPQIVDQQLQPILDESEIYSGCYVYATLRPYAWEYEGKRGVSFGLQNLQLVKTGPRLDGRASASDEFEPVDMPDSGEEMGL